MRRLKNKYKLVGQFPHWQGFKLYRFNPHESSYAYIFEWILCLGFWQIWKWEQRTVKEIDKIWGVYE